MYNFVKASLKLFYRLFYKVTIVNGEKIENAKGVVISGNHLSNHDPLLFPAFFNKEIRFMAKEELFKIFFIKYSYDYQPVRQLAKVRTREQYEGGRWEDSF